MIKAFLSGYYMSAKISTHTGEPRSYRNYILQITQPSKYSYARLQYIFAVTSGSPSTPSSEGYFPTFKVFRSVANI